MRRRIQAGTVPPLLATFDPSDWSGTKAQRLEAWVLARRTYFEANGWPGGFVDLLAEEREVHRLANPQHYSHHLHERRRL